MFEGASVIVDERGWPVAAPLAGGAEGVVFGECRLERARDKWLNEWNDVLSTVDRSRTRASQVDRHARRAAREGSRHAEFWHDLLPQPIVPRDPLTGRHEFDVAIVGGSYTGLWTAYYLAKADPHLRICMLEKVFCGFGASGRNGGWCSAHFPASLPKMAASSGRAAAVAEIRELFSTIDEIARVLGEEGIEASWHKGGTLRVAVNAAQVEGLRRRLADQRAWGFAEDDYVWLSADEARSRVNVGAAVAGHYTPHCAAFDPARLAVGLVAAVERLGVRVFEQSPVLGFDDRRLELASGLVSADVIVLAMEAYAAATPRWHRDLIPR